MKNPRYSGGGGFLRNLAKDIEGCPDKNLNADEVVNYLLSFKKYKRKFVHTGVQGLTRQVQTVLQKARTKKLVDDGASDSSVVYTSTNSDKKTEGSEDDDDSDFEEECEPKVDLMKSLIREKYGGKRKKAGEDEEAMEIEVVTNNGSKKSRAEKKMKDLDSRGGGDNVSAKAGPMFENFGGIDGLLDVLAEDVIEPLFYNPDLAVELKGEPAPPVEGILLHGPPGCGKTTLARAIANETGFPLYMTVASQLVNGIIGNSEENMRELFSRARSTAPSIIFIDEIDAISSKKENQQRGSGIASQLLACMDPSHQVGKPGHVLVIVATNKPDAMELDIRRRFLEFALPVPDESARLQILSVLTKSFKVDSELNLLKIARATPGFVGADLARLANKAYHLARRRAWIPLKAGILGKKRSLEWLKKPLSPEQIKNAIVTMADFEVATTFIQPTSKKEGFSDIPDVKWDDIGGLHQLREDLYDYIIEPIKFPEEDSEDQGTGILLYGPPGCGKTLIAKAAANEAGANFIHIKAAELLSKYVGESEKAVGTLFSRARTCSPCIIFFDEVDALTRKCGSEGESVADRVLKRLQIELDGGESRKGVHVIGATNSPEAMAKAALRPGRFGKHLYVPLPSAEERGLILKTLARKQNIDAGVDLMAIGKDLCERFSGADLNNFMDEAARAARNDRRKSGLSTPLTIKYEHFIRALEIVSPSVSEKQIRHYLRISGKFKAGLL